MPTLEVGKVLRQYYFWNENPELNSRLQTFPSPLDSEVIEKKVKLERPVNCYLQCASDVPAAGEIRPAQEQQDPARATAKSGPSKGTPAGKPAAGAVDITTALKYLGGQ